MLQYLPTTGATTSAMHPFALAVGGYSLVALTEVQVFSLYNILCLCGVVFISSIVSRRYPSSFFTYWLRAYLGIGTLVVSEFIASFTGRMLALDVLEVTVATLTGWQLAIAGNAIRGAEPFGKLLPSALFAATAISLGLMALHVPYGSACLPAFLSYMLGLAWLGICLLRTGSQHHNSMSRHIGWPIIAAVLWATFSYPLLMGTPLFWLGFLVTGLLQLSIGGGMVLFVVEDGAEQVRRQNERLRELDTMKDHLLGMVSHELRTPISAINTAAFLMLAGQQQTLSPHQLELMEIVKQNITLLGRLVVDIMDITKMESGMLSYQPEHEDLGIVIGEAARGNLPKFMAKNVELRIDTPEPVYADFDRTRITQVLTNLLENALKFTPSGGTVAVRVFQDDRGAVFDVKDSGPGIAPEHQTQIFDKFFQVDNTTTRKAGGLGLGLAIARGIVVDGHRGDISVDSQPGAGTRFTVRLPIEPARVRENPPAYV